MKKMVALVQAGVIWLLWSTAQGATLKSTRGSASGMAAHATALVHERESFEARSHAQLAHWCNVTLPAQGSRRTALQHLLLQAQSSQAPAGPEGSETPALVQLETKAANLGGEIERERVQAQSLESAKRQEVLSTKLYLDDASKDVQALQQVFDRLGGVSSNKPGVTVAAQLLANAKDVKRQAQQRVALLQSSSHSSVSLATNISQLESQYRSSKSDIVSSLHQFFTTQRSLDVLIEAIEDESGYFSDLQSICGAESLVHTRVESEVMPVLRRAPALATTEATTHTRAVSSTPMSKPTEHVPATPKPAKETAQVIKEAVSHKTAEPKHAQAAPAKKTIKAKAHTQAAKPKPVQTPKAQVQQKATAVKKAKPSAPKPKAASSPPAPKSNDPFADDDADTSAPPPPPAKPKQKKHATVAPPPKPQHTKHKSAPASPTQPMHKKPKVSPTKKTVAPPPPAPKTKDPFADDDDDASTPPPPPPQPKHKKRKAAPAPPPPAPKAKDPFADDDDDASPPPPPPKPKHKKRKAAPAPPPPAPKVKDPFADDDDDTPPPPPPPQPKHKKRKAAPAPPPPPPKAKDPFADDDDDVPPPPPQPKHKKRKAAPPPPPPKAKDPFADDDDDAAVAPPPQPKHKKQHAPVATAELQMDDTPPAPKNKKAGKAPPKNEFMDGVYDSAAGNLPTAYAAWKPDDAPSAPAPPPPAHSAASGADAKKAMMDMLGTEGDDDSMDLAKITATPASSSTVPKKATSQTPVSVAPADSTSIEKTVTTPAKAPEVASGSDMFDAPKSKPSVADDEDALSAMKKAVNKQDAEKDETAFSVDDSLSSTKPKKSSDSFDFGDDSTPAKAPVPTKPKVSAPKPAAPKGPKGPVVSAMMNQLDDDDDKPLEMPSAHKKIKEDAAPAPVVNLPTQYSAWTPSDQAATDKKHKEALAEMEAGFDDDDDAPPTPAPKPKHRHRKRAPAPVPTPAPKPKASSDGVVYDDDDLPKHHVSAMAGLEGGWEALMKTPKKKVVKGPKLDQDVAIMQSLYTKDGGLPSQYKAWSPDDDAPKAPSPPPASTHQDSGDSDDDSGQPMDLEAAAKAFAKNPDSAFDFLQVASESKDPIGKLIEDAAANPFRHRAGASFLEASSVAVDSSRIAVASTVLEQYSEVLRSRPLQQLAKAKLSPAKLQELYQQLRNVDPLAGSVTILAQGKQARAEQMCKYFQDHVQVAGPVQKTVSLVEVASNELAESVSRRAALLEEIDARTQLQKTMEQDTASLTMLANLAKKGEDASGLEALEKQLTGVEANAIGASTGELKEAHAELKDLLDLSLRKRTAALQDQRKKLSQLQSDVKKAEADLAAKKQRAATAQATMETARRKLAGITTSCDSTLNALAHRRHAGHMEAHAIEVALKVLGEQ